MPCTIASSSDFAKCIVCLFSSPGIQVIVFGIGNPNDMDMSNLKTMTSYPYQVNLITVDRTQDLVQHEETFREFICNSEYMLGRRTSRLELFENLAFWTNKWRWGINTSKLFWTWTAVSWHKACGIRDCTCDDSTQKSLSNESGSIWEHLYFVFDRFERVFVESVPERRRLCG